MVHRRGFTLIELLVVIAIMAILAAILFPVFAQAREKARQASCTSNVRQLSSAVMQYTQDFDERYPMAFYTFSASGTTLSWPLIVQPYLKNVDVLVCPSTRGMTGNPPSTTFPVTYAYNYYIGGNNNPNGGIMNIGLAEVNKPADTVLAVDSGTNPVQNVSPELWTLKQHATRRHTSWLLAHAGSSLLLTNPPSADYGAPHARHAGMTTVLWADGHVRPSRIEKIYTLPGMRSTNPPPPVGAALNWSPCLDPAFGCP